MNDLTIIYITANLISDHFAKNVQNQLLKVIGNTPIISVSKKMIDFGQNIVTEGDSSYLGIYKDLLIGAKAATTRYVAIAEDDTLYSPDHFKYRPKSTKFAYNIGCWGLFTWSDPAIFSWRGRKNNNGLICDREAYIETMEERFRKYPIDSEINLGKFAEPGKYEHHLGVNPIEFETFFTNPANIMVFHPTGSSFSGLGQRKRLGELRAYEIPFWGRAEDVLKLYE